MPAVQDRIPRSGLLQSAVVTLYTIYLTWSALSNNPDQKCHTGEIFPTGANSKVRCSIGSIDGRIEYYIDCRLLFTDLIRQDQHCWLGYLVGLHFVQLLALG